MKISSKILLWCLGLFASASFSHAQLISRSFDVSANATGAKVHINMWINLNTDTVAIDLDNTLTGNPYAGTITGIAINTPFTVASQTNDNPGTVTFKAKWTVGSASGLAPNTWSNDDFWTETAPTTLGGTYPEDYGVYAPALNQGVSYGEKATFVFQFNSQDINKTNYAGFFDKQYDFALLWQDLYKPTSSCCCSDVCSDKGAVDLLPNPEQDLPPTPEPSTYGLIGGAALLGLIVVRKRSTKKV